MKIKSRMLLGNLLVGLLPVLLAIGIFTAVISIQAENQVKDNLSAQLQDLKLTVDNDMESYRSYAYFFGYLVEDHSKEAMKGRAGYRMTLAVETYGLKLLEYSYKDEVVRQDFYPREISRFLTGKQNIKDIWKFMDKPINQPVYKMSFPEVISNTTVIRNCAFVYDRTKLQNTGVAIVSAIMNNEYLIKLAGDNSDLIIYTETTNNKYVFGRDDFNAAEATTVLNKANISNESYAVVNIDGERYYASKTTMFSKSTSKKLSTGRIERESKPISYIGVLYGFESVNKIVFTFQKVAVIVFIISAVIALLIALLFARKLTVPILKLKDMAGEFEKDFTPVPVPTKIDDEIDILHKSFSDMSSAIIEKTSELQEANNAISALVEQQHGDYFLTSLLIKPLISNAIESNTLRAKFYINQKKKFKFKHWEAQLGGDLCIARSIILQGKKYIAFSNGDAMGKSMQGAGGALVMGVMLNSIIDRSQTFEYEQNKTPRQWVENTYQELEAVFESFDGSMMMSCITGVIEEETGLVTYFNAEHPWLVIYRDGKAIFAEDESEVGRKLGTMGFAELFVKEYRLKPGDVMLMGSDGKDDIKLGMSEEGHRIINEDETLFLKYVEKANGDINEIAGYVENTGELTDDFTMLRIGYRESVRARKDIDLSSQDESIDEPLDEAQTVDTNDLKQVLAKAVEYYKDKNFAVVKQILIDVYNNNPDAKNKVEVLNLLGSTSFKLQQYQEAIKYWQEAKVVDPQNTTLDHNIDVARKRMGD